MTGKFFFVDKKIDNEIWYSILNNYLDSILLIADFQFEDNFNHQVNMPKP